MMTEENQKTSNSKIFERIVRSIQRKLAHLLKDDLKYFKGSEFNEQKLMWARYAIEKDSRDCLDLLLRSMTTIKNPSVCVKDLYAYAELQGANSCLPILLSK